MTATNFPQWFSFMERPDFDGQGLHNTPGDPGGATNRGWTFATWEGFAKLHKLDASFAHFSSMQRDDFMLPSRLAFWNAVKADQLPAGIDVIWCDFQFGSFNATRVLQAALGIEADNSVGPQTIQACWAVNNKAAFIQQMTNARLAYYKMLSTYVEFGNGWNRRAIECAALARNICGIAVAPPPVPHQIPANTTVDSDQSADALMAAEQAQLVQGNQT